MSFIVRDALGPAISNMNANFALYKRFNRVWKNDGVFYNERLVYFDGHKVRDDKPFKDLIHMMGLTVAQLKKQNYDEIEEAWFYLEQPEEKAQDFDTGDTISYMVPEEKIVAGDIVEIKYDYNGVLNQRVPEDYGREIESVYHSGTNTDYNVTNSIEPIEIRDNILADAGNYIISNKQILSSGGFSQINTTASNPNHDVYQDLEYNNWSNDPYTNPAEKTYKYKKPVCSIKCNSRYGWYAAFDNNQEVFEQISVSDPVGTTDHFSFTVEYKAKKQLESSDECVVEFNNYFNSYHGKFRKEASMPMKVTQEDYFRKYPLNNDALWVNGRLSVPAVSQMKKKDFAELFPKMINSDSEQEEDDKAWWESFLAIILVIVSVVLAVMTYGAAAPAFGTIGGLAISFGVAAISLSVSSVILTYTAGESASMYIKIIGKFANISSMLAKVFGVVSVVQNFFKSVSSDAIMEAATEKAAEASTVATKELILNEATELANSSFVNRAINVSIGSVSESLSMVGDSFVGSTKKMFSWLDNAFSVYKYYDENYGKTGELSKELQDTKDEIEKIREQNEENAPSNLELTTSIDSVFVYSVGVYDVIAECELQQQNLIEKYLPRDPMENLT